MDHEINCPECGHSGGYSDFQDEENFAPDLADILYCPECDHSFEDPHS